MSEDLEFIKTEKPHSLKEDEVDALASDEEEEVDEADRELFAKIKRDMRDNEVLTIDAKGTKVVDSMLPEINTHEDLKPKKKRKKKSKSDLFIDDSEVFGGAEAKDEDNPIMKTIKE